MSKKSFWLEDAKQTGNYTNEGYDTFDPQNHYIGVRLQQGVPLLDRDWNELEDIRRYQELMLRQKYIGNGTPNDGFKISVTADKKDFQFSKGSCLVDGLEAVNDDDVLYSDYCKQKKVPYFALPASDVERVDTIYLEVWIEEIRSKKRDDSLSNSKDVKHETCVRHQVRWQVLVATGISSYPNAPVPEAIDDFHHLYLLSNITWKRGMIYTVGDLRTTRVSVPQLRDEIDKIMHATVDSWVSGGDIIQKGPDANNVYELSLSSMTCIINGKIFNVPGRVLKETILPGQTGIVLSSPTVIAAVVQDIGLYRWYEELVARKAGGIRDIPLYLFVRQAGGTELDIIDLREPGILNSLANAIHYLDQKVFAEKHLYLTPYMFKYESVMSIYPEWINTGESIHKPANQSAYGVMPLSLPDDVKISKFRAVGTNPFPGDPANRIKQLGIVLTQLTFDGNTHDMKALNPAGTPTNKSFDSSVSVDFKYVSEAKYYILATAPDIPDAIYINGIDITYVHI